MTQENAQESQGSQEPKNQGDSLPIESISKYLMANKDNEDVKDLVNKLRPVDSNLFEEWLQGDDGKKYFLPLMDKKITQAINTYKDGHFQEEVETRVRQEVLKINPDETPEQKRLRELEQKFEQEKKNRRFEELKNVASSYGNSKNLNVGEFIYKFVADNEEQTRLNIDKFAEYKQLWIDQAKNEIMAQNKHVPGSGDNNDKLRFNNMSEVKAYMKKNPGAYSDPEVKKEIFKTMEAEKKRR